MPLYLTEAVVLSSMDFGESDKIVTFYTISFGKLKGIAKGAKRSKKRFGINLEPFSLVTLHFFEKKEDSLVRVSACDLINPFQAIRDELFTLLTDFLGILEARGVKGDLLRVFEPRPLDRQDLKPNLPNCVICHTP